MNRKKSIFICIILMLSMAITACGAGAQGAPEATAVPTAVITQAPVTAEPTAEGTGASESGDETGASGSGDEAPVTDAPATEAPAENGSETEPAEKADTAPLLWHVSSDEYGGELWLFGSIHVAESTLYPLDSAVLDAYAACDTLAVEVDIVALQADMVAMISSLRPLVYSDGTTIKDHISPELYAKAKERLTEMKLYNSLYDMYKPYLWVSLIDACVYEEAGLDEESGVDMHFLKQAKKDGKKISEIESAQEQYELLGGFSDEIQEYMLTLAVEESYISDSVTELQALYGAWRSGDEALLAEMLTEEAASQTETEYYEQMMGTRNVKMIKAAEEYIQKGEKVFYVVGAAHMQGADGIVHGLTEKGYAVERIEY